MSPKILHFNEHKFKGKIQVLADLKENIHTQEELKVLGSYNLL